MTKNGYTAWLITDELESERGPVTVLAVLNANKGMTAVEEAVDTLWRALHLTATEKLQYRMRGNPPPYRPEWTKRICYCGHGSVIVARYVTGLREVPYGQGIDGIMWDGMPTPPATQ